MKKNFFSVLCESDSEEEVKLKKIGTVPSMRSDVPKEGIHTQKSFYEEMNALHKESNRPDQEFLAKIKAFSGAEVSPGLNGDECRDHLSFTKLLTACGVIREVSLKERGQNLMIKGDKLTFLTEAYGDCCSASWFEPYVNMSFQDLVGKSVVTIKMEKGIKYAPSKRDEYDQNDLYSLVLINSDGSPFVRSHADAGPSGSGGRDSTRAAGGRGGKAGRGGRGKMEGRANDKNAGGVTKADPSNFKFLFRNSSNGYYSGYHIVQSCCATGTEEVYVKNPDARVVFVLGLPGSGKTTFVRNHLYTAELKSFGYKSEDDCLFDPLFSLQTKQRLERGERLILNDPRFCEVDKFEHAFSQVLRSLVSAKQISIVTFENNPEQCIKNNKKERYDYRRQCENTPEYVSKLSEQYTETLNYLRGFGECMQHSVPVAVPPDRDAILKLRRGENEAKGDYLSLLCVF